MNKERSAPAFQKVSMSVEISAHPKEMYNHLQLVLVWYERGIRGLGVGHIKEK